MLVSRTGRQLSSHGGDKNLARLVSFEFRIYDVTCKPTTVLLTYIPLVGSLRSQMIDWYVIDIYWEGRGGCGVFVTVVFLGKGVGECG